MADLEMSNLKPGECVKVQYPKSESKMRREMQLYMAQYIQYLYRSMAGSVS